MYTKLTKELQEIAERHWKNGLRYEGDKIKEAIEVINGYGAVSALNKYPEEETSQQTDLFIDAE